MNLHTKVHIRSVAVSHKHGCFVDGDFMQVLNFPGTQMDGTSEYTSIGCEWMVAANPVTFDKLPLGTPEQIARCHANGETISSREYNPLERGWCRDQVRPFLDQCSALSVWCDHDVMIDSSCIQNPDPYP